MTLDDIAENFDAIYVTRVFPPTWRCTVVEGEWVAGMCVKKKKKF